MGLKRIRERAKTVPVGEVRTLKVMIEGEEETLLFRVPGIVAVQEAVRLASDAATLHQLPEDMAVQVVLLAKTYLPSPEDGVISPVEIFAEMAKEQPEAFLAISTGHGTLMADAMDWAKVRSAEKNA